MSEHEKKKAPARSWLYKHGEESRVFEGDEITAAVEAGWHDSPDKAKAAAGENAVNTSDEGKDGMEKELREARETVSALEKDLEKALTDQDALKNELKAALESNVTLENDLNAAREAQAAAEKEVKEALAALEKADGKKGKK